MEWPTLREQATSVSPCVEVPGECDEVRDRFALKGCGIRRYPRERTIFHESLPQRCGI